MFNDYICDIIRLFTRREVVKTRFEESNNTPSMFIKRSLYRSEILKEFEKNEFSTFFGGVERQ